MATDIRQTLEKYTAMPLDRFRVVQRLEDLQLQSIRRGIIFIFAAWSGPAIVAFKRFTSALKSLDTSSLDIVILDIDCLTNDFAHQLFTSAHLNTAGVGETIWVRDGSIVAGEVSLPHGAETSIIRRTNELLDEWA